MGLILESFSHPHCFWCGKLQESPRDFVLMDGPNLLDPQDFYRAARFCADAVADESLCYLKWAFYARYLRGLWV